MDLGVDFGTTRTITAVADRGNYPVVNLTDELGDPHDGFPSVVALRDGKLVHGFEALAAAQEGAPVLRSFKRVLASAGFGANTPVTIGDAQFPAVDVLESHLRALREALSAAGVELSDDDRVVVAVPAHAHGPQRMWTIEAFRRAGFPVVALMNEPSAAGFEYTHRQPRTISSRRTRMVVYDLGGGTFDASLVDVTGTAHDVLDSLGINDLGGDDFDDALMRLVLDRANVLEDSLSASERDALLNSCRDAKERLTPQTRRMMVELGEQDVIIPAAEYYDEVTPLVERSIDSLLPLMGQLEDGEVDLTDIAGIYLVGGASGLPLVPRVLRDRFGRRVFRSPYPSASTAIGLAIAADPSSGYSLTDRLSRGFGVYREDSGGTLLSFDPILERTEEIPSHDQKIIERRYRAAHNIGVFRFVEYSRLDGAGHPINDVAPFGELVFPFDQQLENADLEGVEVERRDWGPEIEEHYVIDPSGIVTVRITNLDTGHQRTASLAN